MIGQKHILEWVNKNVDSFPHFIVVVGPRGSGKRTLVNEIANKVSCVYTQCEPLVDTVREVIDSSYNSQTKVMYCFADADNMKPQAKNAMLKITEEPPENAYFCLTINDDSSLLGTIKSRAYVLTMENYSRDELKEYYYRSVSDDDNREAEVNLFCAICSNPGEIDMLTSYGKEFYDYVNLVADNIANVEPANAFKSSSKLALKSDEGYDLRLFLRCFMLICEEHIMSNDADSKKFSRGIIVTAKAYNAAGKMGVNKQQLYDKWVFDIRGEWV